MTEPPASAEILVRDYRPDDAADLLRLFRAAVRVGARRDYSQAQVEAWAPDAIDFERWSERLADRISWVAEIAGRAVGFADLETDGHLDMLYVDPAHHRCGAAGALLARAEAEARARGLQRLYTEASLTAWPVFEARGYRVIAAQTVAFNGQSFLNFRMEKPLGKTSLFPNAR